MATASGSQTVLERKLAAARHGDRGDSRSALRALRLALARAAADAAGLPLAVIGATQARCGADGLGDLLDGDRMFLRLDGAGGQAGAVAMDRALVAALIRQQTTGRADPAGGRADARPFTPTDAALTAPVLSALMDRAPALAEAADRDCLEGFAFGAAAGDLRRLLLALDADRFRLFSLTIEIAGGPAQATLVLALPDVAEAPDTARAPGGRPRGTDGGSFAQARAQLSAVVGRVRLPLARLAEMQPGDLLPLSEGRIDQTDLVAIDGRRVALGKLGRAGGLRAVRLGNAGSVADKPLDGRAFPAPRVDPPKPAPEVVATEEDDGETYERHLMNLSPEQAAAEISELAGLSPAETDDDAAAAGLPVPT